MKLFIILAGNRNLFNYLIVYVLSSSAEAMFVFRQTVISCQLLVGL